MNNSLRDQMLKSGLISKKQVKKLEQQTKLRLRKQQKKSKKDRGAIDEKSIAYQAARKAEIAKTKKLNIIKEEQRLQKELQAQTFDIIQRHKVNDPDADIAYNFIDSNKLVKQIFVTNIQKQQLINGDLAIVHSNDNYYLIPAPIAEKLLERVPEIIVCYNNTEVKPEEDDPYADYQVPDDLMW
ncbi:MAG TPA: DUF2058 domain-containing protein [Thioploca sp.]|nr:DUF2058 domain-containing protein [Thioploca sp.]